MKWNRAVVFVLALPLCVCHSARATFSVFNTSAGSTVTDGTVNASVSFTTSSDQIHISLQNLQADPRSVGQNLSALLFTIDTGQHAGSIISSSGLERTVSRNGTFADGSTVAAGWVLSSVSNSLQLDVLSGAGHAGPAHTLIGAPNALSNEYDNANASI